jgi:hypothetical protein
MSCRGKPGGIAGSISTVMVPGGRKKLRLGHSRPEFNATGRNAPPIAWYR